MPINSKDVKLSAEIDVRTFWIVPYLLIKHQLIILKKKFIPFVLPNISFVNNLSVQFRPKKFSSFFKQNFKWNARKSVQTKWTRQLREIDQHNNNLEKQNFPRHPYVVVWWKVGIRVAIAHKDYLNLFG